MKNYAIKRWVILRNKRAIFYAPMDVRRSSKEATAQWPSDAALTKKAGSSKKNHAHIHARGQETIETNLAIEKRL